ncbi:hypothetical protein [Companilactobacillus kimchiensis]|uniref:Uncharacterized protein n=1 Tax=Companilactobacillus kimchiensis TaxID=993692 RepID=A0A0R2LKU7_9LACO|nr:hypothetical protein [Companilactobacillus kimchiensis]KRN99245.1 hypothetical protein IV57_GL000467 [Companilactobacillus kimchiensis]
MFTYIQITSRDSDTFKGYVDYEFSKDNLSMTLVRGMKTLRRINIPISEITDLNVDNFYGEERINFIYDSKKYSFINTGYGESFYLKNRMLKAVNS